MSFSAGRSISFSVAKQSVIANPLKLRYDGAGYPSALRDEAIPVLAKIGGVAGAYDALLETTPYHKDI